MAVSNTVFQTVRQLPAITFIRCMSKHYDPKFKWFRRKKVVDLGIDFKEKPTPEVQNRKMRELGIRPMRMSKEVPYYIGSTVELIEPYTPSEGDGKYSLISTARLKGLKEDVTARSKNIIHTRRIRKYDPDFEVKTFPAIAQDIYIKAHEILTKRQPEGLLEYATGKAIQAMMLNVEKKTIRWKFIESLDPPRVVHVRMGELLYKGNDFAQVTVRFHTKQMLAVYDRFGRLMCGSEVVAKDVLEYVVFEKHVANIYGIWKLHDKIIPDGVSRREPAKITYTMPLDDSEEDLYDDGGLDTKGQLTVPEETEEERAEVARK